MVHIIRQTVTVEEGGRVSLRSAQLAPGTKVKVLVVLDPAEADAEIEKILDDPEAFTIDDPRTPEGNDDPASNQ